MGNKSVGIIVGRFQVPELHKGHKYLISSVNDLHDMVFVFLGTPKDESLTLHDPLPYVARKKMMKEYMDSVEINNHDIDTIYEIVDRGDWKLWVKDLDDKIDSLRTLGLIPGTWDIYICGSRDSVVSKYKESGGKYYVDFIPENGKHSGTSMRDNFVYNPEWTENERKVALWTIKEFLKK